MRNVFLSVALLAAVPAAYAAYQYYYTDTFSSINAGYWHQNGSGTAGSTGLNSTSAIALISTLGIPGGTDSSAEVRMKLRLTQSGGYYFAYLAATQNALGSSTSTGSFYSIQIWNPQIQNGVCSARLRFLRTVNGAVSVVLSNPVTCHDGMVLRSVNRAGELIAYMDNVFAASWQDPSPLAGQPGVGVAFSPAGNSITEADLGALDRTAPSAVDPNTVSRSVMPTSVDLSWAPAADDANGTGVAYYNILRNGATLGESTTAEYMDWSAQAATSYTYTLQATDFHGNVSSTNVAITTPAAVNIDARRTGVRPTGAYWGGGGEQIDMRSGNLNYSVPVLTAMGRGRWSVPFRLTYNSQNWKYSGGKSWLLGHCHPSAPP